MNSNSLNPGDKKNIKIIVDEPAEEDVLDFQRYSENLANIIRGTTPPQFAVGIFGKWGTGKTTLMRMIEKKLDKDREKILTVWFDAWRYEKEKYLAVIPFLRLMRIALDKDSDKIKKPKWIKVKKALQKTSTAFIESTDISIAAPGYPASIATSPKRFWHSLKSKGSIFISSEHIQFHEHATDYLKRALDDLRKDKETEDSRIVVFVDDLDRCTPEKALEVLESIKAFFDIKGIVYVIGMDSESIDHIIKQKYGENSNIKGLDYLQKIVQVPFQIPVWKHEDITESIEKIISKELEGSELIAEFKKDDRKSLIVKAIEANPRQVKRFINNIILARSVFRKPGKDIEIDKLIAVQALNFRSEWNRFLELITPDPIRWIFFDRYYIPLKESGKVINSTEALDNLKKEKANDKKPLPEVIVDIFQELVKPENAALRSFLDYAEADKKLLDIDKMEDFRRALEATKLEEEKHLIGKREPINKLLLELLGTGRAKEFNDVCSIHSIHPDLSGANLSNANLTEANLSNAYLSGANLSFANLSNANLSKVKLSNANLSFANLSNANLSHCDFSGSFNNADFVGANLSSSIIAGADFNFANFSGADLSKIELAGADSPFASFTRANFRNTKFCDANICYSIFTDADFYEADLSGANLTESEFTNANLSKVIVNDETTALGIRLASKEGSYNLAKEKDALGTVDRNLRGIIIRDNSALK